MAVLTPPPPSRIRAAGRNPVDRLRAGTAQARQSWVVILQATVAAMLAYAAAEAIGHEQPFFAPIAAIATVAISLSQRLRRASELLLGNAIGIALADFLVVRIGTGAWQVGLVVAIALTSAIIAGGGPILIMQSTSAAVLIATLTPPTPDQPWNTGRFVDALIGGAVGLVVSALLMPVDPARHARSATAPVIAAIAEGYRRVGQALVDRDAEGAQQTLSDLRDTSPLLTSFRAGLDATRESIRLVPWYWGQRGVLATYALAGTHLDNALRNLRVLARQAGVALDRDEHVPASLPRALELLAVATRELPAALSGDHAPEAAQRAILAAVAATTAGADPGATAADAPDRAGMFTAPMVAQVRLSASDLLQATGLTGDEAATAIRSAGDRSVPPHEGPSRR